MEVLGEGKRPSPIISQKFTVHGHGHVLFGHEPRDKRVLVRIVTRSPSVLCKDNISIFGLNQ